MKYPVIISHYTLRAKIYKGVDGYHAVWSAGGKRVKRQYKRLKDARAGAMEALKLVHKGQIEIASLAPVELVKLSAARNLLRESRHADFTKAQIDELQKALPKCLIIHYVTK